MRNSGQWVSLKVNLRDQRGANRLCARARNGRGCGGLRHVRPRTPARQDRTNHLHRASRVYVMGTFGESGRSL